MSGPAPRGDAIAVTYDRRADPIRRALDELLTRSFYSGAGYVFECDPFALPEDGDVFALLSSVRQLDRRHAHVLGELVEKRGGVPSTGVFPWWNLDLNYLTVPCLSRFVLESLREDVAKLDALVAKWASDDAEGRAALALIRAEKSKQVSDLEPVVVAAEKREVDAHASKIAAVKKARDARIAKEKAAAEAAKKAKQAAATAAKAPAAGAAAPAAAKPAAGLTIGDPAEPGISRRERGRRVVLLLRQKAGKPLSLLPSAPSAAVAAAAKPVAAPAAAAAPAAGGELLDSNEPGISPKEKARRQIAKNRAAGAPAPAAPTPTSGAAAAAVAAPAPAAPAAAAVSLAGADLLDPNEPGISPKEKARRQIAKARAAGGGPAPSAAPAPAAAAPAAASPTPAAASPTPAAAPAADAPAPLPADLGDPNEPGISPKEKARRQMARMRAQRG